MNGLNLMRDGHEKEVVQLCRDLLKIKSVNPPGDESAAAEYSPEFWRKQGWKWKW